MADRTSSDQRVESVKQRLREDLVDEQGQPAEPHEVARVVDAKADSFADAPVQEFVPLLIEHQARDERHQGLHRDLGDEDHDTSRTDGEAVD
jgi:hypothetical protein